MLSPIRRSIQHTLVIWGSEVFRLSRPTPAREMICCSSARAALTLRCCQHPHSGACLIHYVYVSQRTTRSSSAPRLGWLPLGSRRGATFDAFERRRQGCNIPRARPAEHPQGLRASARPSQKANGRQLKSVFRGEVSSELGGKYQRRRLRNPWGLAHKSTYSQGTADSLGTTGSWMRVLAKGLELRY
jgi:hypothetical protein